MRVAGSYVDFPELGYVGPVVGRQAQKAVLYVQQLAGVVLQHHVGGMEMAILEALIMEKLQDLHLTQTKT